MDSKNEQEHYSSIMTKKLAKRIIELRDLNISWKDLSIKIKEEFGDEYSLEQDTITGMYLEYSARDYLNK